MSYQVLARKWRPRVFAELVGQAHVVTPLTNALKHERVHHAFLFSGTRGVGKTTIARIFAKALNCETGVSAEPCGQCSACREIDEGRFVDLIEVDAASRTKVDDTRELLENVPYAPTRGRYKVYLIDEVHMLSNHSFNALLKTLEEPPPHVKFLLATTDPQKLPVTVLSRCLQFNLKRLPLEAISRHLEHILQSENIAFEPAALTLLAAAAEGSVRDSLSLLDQAIAFSAGTIRTEDVRSMLGSISHDHVVALLNALADAKADNVLAVVGTLLEQGADPNAVLAELIVTLHLMALLQVQPQLADDRLAQREQLTALARRLSPEDVQLYYQIAVMARRDMPHVPDPRGGLEMALLRMLAFCPADQAQPPAAATPVKTSAAAVTTAAHHAKAALRPTPSMTAAPADEGCDDWEQIVESLGLEALVRELAVNSVLVSRQDQLFKIRLSELHSHLKNERFEKRLEQALQRRYGDTARLVVELGKADDTPTAKKMARQQQKVANAREALENDLTVRQLKEVFGAEMLPESIQPAE